MTSKKLQIADIEPTEMWNSHRAASLQHILKVKQQRRAAIGSHLSVLFENWETVLFQVQEVLRAEFISEPEQVQEELDIYNQLIPQARELSATLFIDLLDSSHLDQDIARFVNVEQALELRFAGHHIRGEAEPVEPSPGRTVTVHYLRFRFTPRQADAFGRGAVELAVRLPRYQARVKLSPATAAALAQHLSDTPEPARPTVAGTGPQEALAALAGRGSFFDPG